MSIDEFQAKCYEYVDIKGSVCDFYGYNMIIGIRPMIKINLEKII